MHDVGDWPRTEQTPVVVVGHTDSDPNQSTGVSPINHQFESAPVGLLELVVVCGSCVVNVSEVLNF